MKCFYEILNIHFFFCLLSNLRQQTKVNWNLIIYSNWIEDMKICELSSSFLVHNPPFFSLFFPVALHMHKHMNTYVCVIHAPLSLSLSLSIYLSIYIYIYIWGGFLILLMYLRYPFLIHYCFWSYIYIYIAIGIHPLLLLYNVDGGQVESGICISETDTLPWQVMKNHNSACF